MTTFVLVHGAWHGGWCWRRVADLLERRGHKAFRRCFSKRLDRAIVVWDAATGQLIRKLPTEFDIVDAVAFSIDGKRIVAGGSNSTIAEWEVDSGQFPRSMTGHSGSVRALVFSPDGHRLASGSDDKSLGVWSAY
jgi:WD40 repeat protein